MAEIDDARASGRREAVGRVIAAFAAGDRVVAAADAGIAGAWSDDDLAVLDEALGDHGSTEAWELWDAAEDRGRALYAIGLVLSKDDRDLEAIEVFLAANELGEWCDIELAESYQLVGDWDSAEPIYRRALDARRDEWEYSRAAYRLGEHAFLIGDRFDDDVVELLEAGSTVADEAAVVLSRVHHRRGDPAAARRVLEDAFTENDLVPLVLGNLLRDDVRDTDGARRAYEEGYARGDAYSAFNLALLFEEDLDQPDEAFEWMRRAAAAGDAAARAWLVARGEDGWRGDDGETPDWMPALYDAGLLPFLHGGVLPDEDRRPVFRINEVTGTPSPGVVARAGRLGLPILIEPREHGFDLGVFGSGIAQVRDLTIADAAGTRGWAALAEAHALEELDIDGSEPAEPVDLAGLPNLDTASVQGTNALSVCTNPAVRDLSLTLVDGQPLPVIEAPIEFLGVEGSRAGELLPLVVHPESLEELVLIGASDVDCADFARFPALTDVSLYDCSRVRNTRRLEDLPHLEELQVDDCIDVEDAAFVSALVDRLDGARE